MATPMAAATPATPSSMWAGSALKSGWWGSTPVAASSTPAAPASVATPTAAQLLDGQLMMRQLLLFESHSTRVRVAAWLRRGVRELLGSQSSGRAADAQLAKLLRLLTKDGDTTALRLSSLQALVCVLEESAGDVAMQPLSARASLLPFALAQLRLGTTMKQEQVEEVGLLLCALVAGRAAVARLVLTMLAEALCDGAPPRGAPFSATPTRLAAGSARCCEILLCSGARVSGESPAAFKAALLPSLLKSFSLRAAGAAHLRLFNALLGATGGAAALPPSDAAKLRAVLNPWMVTAAAGGRLSAPGRAQAAALAREAGLDVPPAFVVQAAVQATPRTPTRRRLPGLPPTPPPLPRAAMPPPPARSPLAPLQSNAAASPTGAEKVAMHSAEPASPLPPPQPLVATGSGLRSPLSPLPNLRASLSRLRPPSAAAPPSPLPMAPPSPPPVAEESLAVAAAAPASPVLLAAVAVASPADQAAPPASPFLLSPLAAERPASPLLFEAESHARAPFSPIAEAPASPPAAATEAAALPLSPALPAARSPFEHISVSAAPLGAGVEPSGPPAVRIAPPSPMGTLWRGFQTPTHASPDAKTWAALSSPQPLMWNVQGDQETPSLAADAEVHHECGAWPLDGVAFVLEHCGAGVGAAATETFSFFGSLFHSIFGAVVGGESQPARETSASNAADIEMTTVLGASKAKTT